MTTRWQKFTHCTVSVMLHSYGNNARPLTLCACVCVCASGRGAGPEQEVNEHRLPAEEVGAEQEAPGDHQQEAAGLCAGTRTVRKK